MAEGNPNNGRTPHSTDCMLEKDGKCLVDQQACDYPPLHKREACFNERAGLSPKDEDKHAKDINASREKLGLGPLNKTFFKYRQGLDKPEEKRT